MTKTQNVLQVLKFVLFSISAGVIQIGSFTLLHEVLSLPYWPAYLISLALSVLYNFTVNRRFTFQSAANIPRAMLKVAAYYCVFTPLSTWWGAALTGLGWNEYLVLFGTMLVNVSTEYLFCRLVVYRNAMNTREKSGVKHPLQKGQIPNKEQTEEEKV